MARLVVMPFFGVRWAYYQAHGLWLCDDKHRAGRRRGMTSSGERRRGREHLKTAKRGAVMMEDVDRRQWHRSLKRTALAAAILGVRRQATQTLFDGADGAICRAGFGNQAKRRRLLSTKTTTTTRRTDSVKTKPGEKPTSGGVNAGVKNRWQTAFSKRRA